LLDNNLKYMLRAESLSKSYGFKYVLNKLDLNIEPGELAIVSGANGTGKTTLHLVLSSLIKADTGKIEIAGINIQDDPVRTRSSVGYVSHDPFLYSSLTVRENLIFFAKLYNISYTKFNQTYDQNNLLELLDIADKLDIQVRVLSHGFRKRVGIACSLIHNPSILLFDEPETGLDTQGFDTLLKIMSFYMQKNKSILVTTHADLATFDMKYTHYHIRGGRLD